LEFWICFEARSEADRKLRNERLLGDTPCGDVFLPLNRTHFEGKAPLCGAVFCVGWGTYYPKLDLRVSFFYNSSRLKSTKDVEL